MNLFLQKAFEYLNFFIDHPLESTLVFFVSIIISTTLINYLYRERIATLEERVKLRDDHVAFYKNINSELEKRTSTEKAPTSENNKSLKTPHTDNTKVENESPKTNQIEQSLMNAINSRKNSGLPTTSMQIIQDMQSKYDLSNILSELLRLHHFGKVTWDNAPTLPEHWMELKQANTP